MRHRFAIRILAAGVFATASLSARADDAPLTPNPNGWRPLVYTDLQLPGPSSQSFANIWTDKISANNAAYKKAGDSRYGIRNAPVTEGHAVIRSPVKIVVLSILNTATDCAPLRHDDVATVKQCPMRLAIFTNGKGSISEAGRGCFVEYARVSANASFDVTRTAAYAAYDVDTHTIRLGASIAHEALSQCAVNVPVPHQP